MKHKEDKTKKNAWEDEIKTETETDTEKWVHKQMKKSCVRIGTNESGKTSNIKSIKNAFLHHD